jgi:hypothetical protein
MEEELRWTITDMGACFLALCNALDAKGVLSKAEIAHAAQERLLALQALLPQEQLGPLATLQTLATALERKPGD